MCDYCTFPLCGCQFLYFSKINDFLTKECLQHGYSRGESPECVSFQHFSVSESMGALNHRVLHLYLECSAYEWRGFCAESVGLWCHISPSVLIPANCGAFCRLIKQSLKVTACFFFLLLISPDYCMNCVCGVCVRALWSNNCGCACFSVKVCCVCLLRSTVRMSAAVQRCRSVLLSVAAVTACSEVPIFLCN